MSKDLSKKSLNRLKKLISDLPRASVQMSGDYDYVAVYSESEFKDLYTNLLNEFSDVKFQDREQCRWRSIYINQGIVDSSGMDMSFRILTSGLVTISTASKREELVISPPENLQIIKNLITEWLVYTSHRSNNISKRMRKQSLKVDVYYKAKVQKIIDSVSEGYKYEARVKIKGTKYKFEIRESKQIYASLLCYWDTNKTNVEDSIDKVTDTIKHVITYHIKICKRSDESKGLLKVCI